MSRPSLTSGARSPMGEAAVPMTLIQGAVPQANPDPVAGKTVAEILGEIVWLMTQDSAARDLPIRDIERLVMPAILLRRFHIEYIARGAGTGAAPMPVRVVIWASDDRAGPPAATFSADHDTAPTARGRSATH